MNISPWPSCLPSLAAGPALHMATVDIKNPEINNVRFHNSHSHQQPYHLNNMLSHSGLNRKDKKTKGKKKKLTKADIGTPSNFQWVTPHIFTLGPLVLQAEDEIVLVMFILFSYT